jgi:iron complex transport system ATP-binding protein
MPASSNPHWRANIFTCSALIPIADPGYPISILEPLLLDFENVYVQRGERYALKGLTLKVKAGEHVAVLGPNGSGKSTLLKLLTRECYPLLRPETRMSIFGQSNWNIFDLRAQIGIVSNDLMAQCTREITGRELVLSGFFGSIGLWPNQHVTPEMEASAQEAMHQLEAAELAGRWMDELSSGEARRLLIARALIHNPSTLVLDEPTTSLDLAAQREMRDQLRKLAASGVGLLLVTHHLEELIPEIDRVVLLRKGSVYLDGSKEDVLNSSHLSALFGVEVDLSVKDGYYRPW